MKRSTDEVLAELDALVYDWAAMVERLPGIRKTAACGCTDEARITLGQRENYRMSEFDSGVYMRSTTADERYPACIVLAIKDRWGPGPEAECKFDRHLPHLERDRDWCWAGGYYSCDRQMTTDVGLCAEHYQEIVGSNPSKRNGRQHAADR